MGIRFTCPNGHKLHVKASLSGKRAICPNCGAKLTVPTESGAADAATDTMSPGFDPPLETPSMSIPVIESPSVVPANAPAEGAVARSKPPAPADAAPPPHGGAPTATTFAIQRRNRRLQQTKIALVLLVTAIVLAIVLVWVLMRNANLDEAVETAARAAASQRLATHGASAGERRPGNL